MPKVKFKARTTAEIEDLDIENGSLIYNTENGKTYLDYDDERISTGGGAGGGVATGDTPPENPEENDLWVDTNDEEHLAEVDDEVSTTSTNAVQNQAATKAFGGILLWTNENPTSSMAANTEINLSSSDYDILEIFFDANVDDSNRILLSAKVIKGNSTKLVGSFYHSTGVVAVGREIRYTSDTKLTAMNCYYGMGSVVTDNKRNVPLYIVGYKTGITFS